MKYFKTNNGEVFAFKADGSQDSFITSDMKKMTKAETDRHLNPEKYLSEEEKYKSYLDSLIPLTRRQFMLCLVENDLDESIETAIASIEDNKQRKLLGIEFKDSQVFHRTGEAVIKIFELINLDDAAINTLWEKGLTL